MTLYDRNRLILDRIDHLERIEPDIKDILERGKADQLMQGKDAQGAPFAPLAASTLRHRPGAGPPLAPRFRQSQIVTGYRVEITVGTARLVISAGWPFLSWVKYHIDGTKRMPKRDPSGFRPADVSDAMRRLKDHVLNG